MRSNYMLADLWVMIKAIVVFPLFVVVPGFVAGWLSNVLDFRRRRTLTQFVLSAPLSIALFPIITFWLGRFGGYPAIWAMYSVLWVTFGAIVLSNWRSMSFRPANRAEVWAWIAVAIWVLIAVGSLMHLQFGDKLYYNNAAYDYSVRSPFTAAIMRGIPPANPFFAAFEAVPLRYHYFWMLMCALPAKILKEQPLCVMYGGTVWVGIALISTIALFLRFVLRETENLAQKALVGVGLLLVTGLDLLPTVYIFAIARRLLWNPEWWNEVQVTSWANSMLWVPHYLASLVAALTAFVLLSQAVRSKGRDCYIATAFAGLAFASAAGLGVYVTLVFVLFVAIWVFICVARNWLREAGLVVAAGVIAIAAALPYLVLATHTGAANTAAAGVPAPVSSAKFAQIAVRPLTPADVVLAQHGFSDPSSLTVANVLLLPLNYFLELGFFFIVGVLRWRQLRKSGEAWSRGELACWVLLVSSLIVGSFLTSTTISSNDLGMRSMLPAQFVLLLWAVPLLHSWWLKRDEQGLSRSMRGVLTATLALGVLATIHQVTLLRGMYILLDHPSKLSSYFGLVEGDAGVRVMALRQAFDAIDKQLPVTASVQTHPANPDFVPQMLFNNHPSAAGQPDCGVGFGGDEAKCKPVSATWERLYARPGPDDAAYVDRVCSAYATDVLVVRDSDPVWHVNTWVWSRPVLYANDHVRVFRCGNGFPAASGIAARH